MVREKLDFKKKHRDLYLPKLMPIVIDVPNMCFVMIDGKGDPYGEEYQKAVALLYALSYTIKNSGKKLNGYYDFLIPPLESLWWDGTNNQAIESRGQCNWTVMIRQPEFVDANILAWAREFTEKKKPNWDFKKVRMMHYIEGLCVQALHYGPENNVNETIEKIDEFILENSLIKMVGQDRKYHEIYISDPNKISPDKRKTIVRIPVIKSRNPEQ